MQTTRQQALAWNKETKRNLYTEEEVELLLNQCNCLTAIIADFDWKEWFEKNKK